MRLWRRYSTGIFDRKKLMINKQYAALNKMSNAHRCFFDMPLLTTIEKMVTIKRDLQTVAFVGPNPSYFLRKVDPFILNQIKNFYVCDHTKISLDKSMEELSKEPKYASIKMMPKIIDEEDWPFKESIFDAIISNLQLHWVNKLDTVLRNFYQSLHSDGVLMTSLIGSKSLNELKLSFTMAEQEREGGLSPVIAPMLFIENFGDALSAAGYRIITTDIIRFAYEFESMFDLMKFLQIVGETNVAHERRKFKSKDSFIGAAAVYQTLFSKKIYDAMNKGIGQKIIPVDLFVEHKNAPTNIVGTFEVVYGIGWKEPRESAGTRKISSKEALDLAKLASELNDEGDITFGTIDPDGKINVIDL